MTSIDELTAEAMALRAEVARLTAEYDNMREVAKRHRNAECTLTAEVAKLRGELADSQRLAQSFMDLGLVVDGDRGEQRAKADAALRELAASRTRDAQPTCAKCSDAQERHVGLGGGCLECLNCERFVPRTRDAATPTTTATTGDILLQQHGQSGETLARWQTDDGDGTWLRFILRWKGAEEPADKLSSIALEVLRERLNSRAAKVAQPQRDAAMPGELTFAAFAVANRERCEAPASAGGFARDLTDQTTAVRAMILGVAEEAGEVAGAVRSMLGITTRKTKTSHDVAAEVADLVSYCDLLLQSLGHDLGTALALKFDVVSERTGWPKRLVDAGLRTRDSGGDGEAAEVMRAAGFKVSDWVSPDGSEPVVTVSSSIRDGFFIIKDYTGTADPKKTTVTLAQLAERFPPATREAALPTKETTTK